MRRGLALTAILVSLAVAPTAYALLTQQAVKTSRFYEELPAADRDQFGVKWFAWTQNTAAHPRRFDAFLTMGAGHVKLNAVGSGYVGGIDPPLAVYQQVYRGQSNLKIYNSGTETRSNPPNGVNTDDWEWEPSISGDWLLYGRQDNETDTQWVFLHSLSSATEIMLDEGFTFRHPGQVNGNYAVWTRCDFTCDVVRHDILGDTDVTLPKPDSIIYQYGAAVTSTGVTYVARSWKQCGNAKIVRYFGTGDPPEGTVVANLGSGRDAYSLYAHENADGSVDVFYDRYGCSTSVGDIYRVHDPAPGP